MLSLLSFSNPHQFHSILYHRAVETAATVRFVTRSEIKTNALDTLKRIE